MPTHELSVKILAHLLKSTTRNVILLTKLLRSLPSRRSKVRWN